MLNSYLKSRVVDAKKLIKQLRNHFDYVSILGSFVNTSSVLVSTHMNSIDDVDVNFIISLPTPSVEDNTKKTFFALFINKSLDFFAVFFDEIAILQIINDSIFDV